MKKIPITLTFPEDLVRDLHLYLSKGQISKFVAEMTEKGLVQKKKKIAEEFQNASKDFKNANKDSARNKEIELWDSLSGDGLDETSSY